jgi:phosphotransferase system enzyme I (PtsI)
VSAGTSNRGLGVSPGVAAGPVARMATPPAVEGIAGTRAAGDPATEKAEAARALAAAAADLAERAGKAVEPASSVLTAQSLMATDPALAAKIDTRIDEGADASAAVTGGFDEFKAMLAALGGYFAERVADLDDVCTRALAHLHGVRMPEIPRPGHPYVLVAVDLSPAETATLDPSQVLAIVTERGGPTSHTAILAKAMGVPAVVAYAGAAALTDGTVVLVNGATGLVSADPDPAEIAAAVAAQRARLAALAAVTGPGRTADGHPVALLVNLGADRDLAAAAAADAEGVGLFRTEFLFLDRPTAPTLDEQRAAYARVFAAFAGRKVVVRTLDAGADKPLRFATQPDEPNPALGIRGLRTSRLLPQLLHDQLEAIARAAKDSSAEVWVMAPMVSTAAEAAAFAEAARGHGLSTAGAMVEVPAAALRARQVAAACDFLSIGTNDLAQYTMAADRMNSDLADLLDPWQPAVLELVRVAAEAGRELGRQVGVCGESAADPLLALVLAGLGVTSLSMAPTALGEVRAALAGHTLAECRDLARRALAADDADGARAAVAQASRAV